jgi:hypothetical protein
LENEARLNWQKQFRDPMPTNKEWIWMVFYMRIEVLDKKYGMKKSKNVFQGNGKWQLDKP